MKDFVLIFRNSSNQHASPSPEQMQERMNWMKSVIAQNKLVDKGNRLSVSSAKTVMPGNIVTEGPYAEVKEFINGYMIVKTNTIDEAVELAQANPILKSGGTVEVRAVLTGDDNAKHL